MNLELGLILFISLITLGGIGLAGFALWLKKYRNDETDHVKHEDKLAA